MTRPLFFTLPLILVVSSAIAGPRTTAPTPKQARTAAPDLEASARLRFETGRRLAAEGRCTEANAEFAAGHALSPRPLFLFNMAECARSLGQTARARELYTQFLAEAPDDAFAATARTRLAALEPAPSTSPPAAAAASSSAPTVIPDPARAAEQHTRAAEPTITAQRAPVHTSSPTPLWRKPTFWAVGVGVVVAGSVAVYAATRSGSSCDSCASFR